MAYTAFGERRKGDWGVSDPLPPIIPALTNRGFTGHEHIDEMGLIHMNGRVMTHKLEDSSVLIPIFNLHITHRVTTDTVM